MTERRTWSQVVAELLALHETFRRLGFPADELFVHLFANGQVLFALDRNGKQFTINVGDVADVEGLRKEWLLAVEWWNSRMGSVEELDDIYHSSHTRRNQVSILMALQEKGLYPP